MTSPLPAVICANPDCANPVTRRPTGRPAIYCSPACRPSHRPTGVTVEVDHPETSSDGRPAGRVWTVRLRNRQHVVTIADNLGWPTANALARQLTDLIFPTRTTREATID